MNQPVKRIVSKKRKIALSAIAGLIALILLLALVFGLVDQKMTGRVRSALSSELEDAVQTIVVEGAHLRYRQMGSGQDVLLLIHGFMGSSYDFHQIMPLLAEHFTVFAVDQIGYGLSDKSTALDFSKSNSARLIAGMMDQLGIEQYHILGHSMGGEVAMHIALKQPDRVQKLVLLNSAGITDPQQGMTPRIPEFFIEHVLKNYTLQRIVFNRTVHDRDFASREHFDRFFYFNDQIPAGTLAKITLDNDSGNLADQIGSIRQTSLVIWGRQDRIIPLEQGLQLTDTLQNSSMIILENCGHLPYLEKPQELSGHILEFLQAQQAGSEKP